jgi:hypothetical protein
MQIEVSIYENLKAWNCADVSLWNVIIEAAEAGIDPFTDCLILSGGSERQF